MSSDTPHTAVRPITDALARHEQGQGETPALPRNFTIRKTWLASEAYFPRLLLQLIGIRRTDIPGLQRKHMLGLLLARLFKSGQYGAIASRADALQIKTDGTRLRAFFTESGPDAAGECLKIVRKDSSLAERTRSELAFRKRLSALGTITVPEIHAIREDDDFLYVTEQMIQGHRFSNRYDAPLFISQGIEELCKTYQAIGTRMEPLSAHYSPDLPDRMKAVLGETRLPEGFMDRVTLAFERNPTILIGTCHKDLLPSNLCVADGRLYFLDWELVSDGPVLDDLLKLPLKNRRSHAAVSAVFKALRTHFPEAEKSLPLHFAASIAERIVKNPKKSEERLNYWRFHKNGH
ncbi:phosphotransferase [Sneathiella chinensis]|uniref:Aminoglycoside phosphotransferase domain-containing protein n=1 Tax=Sneathiella chinensis TaxID=349750 RepID=A0ABQ5TYG7_9PROT|nr:phosphotransferase [Sneathiella chinensis]GLQ04837.1 hypothetical protein GCM10007924_00580 [Sneathiella chinensis]